MSSASAPKELIITSSPPCKSYEQLGVVEAGKTGPRRIPVAKFIEDVAALTHDPVVVIRETKNLLDKYKLMEKTISRQGQDLREKLPDIKDALQSVDMLIHMNQSSDECESREVHYKLAEVVYGQAVIKKTATVGLWLGANVLMEYPLNDAKVLLEKNLEGARKNLAENEKDMEFVRTQTTICEVNIARLHNYCVKLRQLAKGGGKLQKDDEDGASVVRSVRKSVGSLDGFADKGSCVKAEENGVSAEGNGVKTGKRTGGNEYVKGEEDVVSSSRAVCSTSGTEGVGLPDCSSSSNILSGSNSSSSSPSNSAVAYGGSSAGSGASKRNSEGEEYSPRSCGSSSSSSGSVGVDSS